MGKTRNTIIILAIGIFALSKSSCVRCGGDSNRGEKNKGGHVTTAGVDGSAYCSTSSRITSAPPTTATSTRSSSNTGSVKNRNSESSTSTARNKTNTTAREQKTVHTTTPQQPKGPDLNTLSTQELVNMGANASGEEALRPLRIASARGSEEAHFLIGEIYFNGNGVTRDMRTALAYYYKSSHLNYSAYRIGQMHLYGWGGLQPNRSKAREWLQVAANAHVEEAQSLLLREFGSTR